MHTISDKGKTEGIAEFKFATAHRQARLKLLLWTYSVWHCTGFCCFLMIVKEGGGNEEEKAADCFLRRLYKFPRAEIHTSLTLFILCGFLSGD